MMYYACVRHWGLIQETIRYNNTHFRFNNLNDIKIYQKTKTSNNAKTAINDSV